LGVHERLEELFQNVLDDEELVITDQMTATDIPGWDSVAHVNLMFSIEQAFGVQFHGNQLAEFANIGELKEFLARSGR
jgi:acyl carrier protein